MKCLADLDPEILAEILGEKPVNIPPPDTSKSMLSPRQRFFMEKAAEEDICLDFFPSREPPILRVLS
jgi:hypothetical protein